MHPPSPGTLDKQYMQVLFPYAYNILGSAEDARDAVQEVLVKHLSGPGHPIADPKRRLTACQVFDLHPQHGTLLQINVVLDPAKLKSLPQQSFDTPLTH